MQELVLKPDEGIHGIGRLTRLNDSTGQTVHRYAIDGQLLGQDFEVASQELVNRRLAILTAAAFGAAP